MPTTTVPLTGLTGLVTLPTGIDFKIEDGDVTENFRIKDGEGLIDEGYSIPVMTGRSLKGKVTGSMTANNAGIANPSAYTSFQNVPFTFTYTTGQTITGNCTVSQFRAVVKVGEITTFECDFESFGSYSSAWVAS